MEKQKGDIKVVRRIQYKYNARGFFPGIRKHLFTVRTRGGKPRQLTEGEFDIESAEWLHRGKAAAFISNLEEDADLSRAKHIYRVDIKGSEPAKLTEGKQIVTALRLSPEGDAIAYTGHDFKKGLATNQNIWLLPVEGGESRNLTHNFDQDIGTKLSCDVRVSSPNPNPGWSPDGKAIYFTSTYGGVARLHRVPRSGGYVEAVLGDVDHSVEAWSMAENGVISYTKLGTTSPIELWVKERDEPRQLTNLNRRWENSLNIYGHERFEFKSSMGHTVEGWLIRPHGFTEGRKYPMVVEIHGGPRGAYGHSLMHEFQVLASQGWVVMYVNPLGSGGYNEEYQAMLPGHYGEQDYTDIMEAVDHILESYDFVDPCRLGVTGGSYGGYMTNWIVTHTDRFSAAVTQRSICNWVSMFGCSDIGWTFTPWEMDSLPWVDEEKYMAKSPIRYVANVRTPTLIIHSEEDHRCPMEQAEQFFTALKYLGVPTELIRFQGENHDLSRSGKPKQREQRLNHIIRWFKQYLA
jgi:dipeptidyl aminopeptidase/acylaminoacyl peptidase